LVWGFAIASWQEENLFRGYLQPLLIESLGAWRGIIAQAALFSVAHIGWLTNWSLFGLVFLTGLMLGWMRGRDRSLVAPFIAHGLIG
jgi:membrane protease YdiL (CAAX protease family)